MKWYNVIHNSEMICDGDMTMALLAVLLFI